MLTLIVLYRFVPLIYPIPYDSVPQSLGLGSPAGGGKRGTGLHEWRASMHDCTHSPCTSSGLAHIHTGVGDPCPMTPREWFLLQLVEINLTYYLYAV